MQKITTPSERRAQRIAVASLLAAVAVAIALIAVPRAVETLTGIPKPARLEAPDDLRPASKDDPMSFLGERDEIVLRVAEATTLREFLDRNRLNKPAQRKQIVAQLGSDKPEAPIAAGTTFRIRLTPTVSDVPGAGAPR